MGGLSAERELYKHPLRVSFPELFLILLGIALLVAWFLKRSAEISDMAYELHTEGADRNQEGEPTLYRIHRSRSLQAFEPEWAAVAAAIA